MKKFAFSRAARLRLKKDFEAVFAAEKKTVTRDLVMWHSACGADQKIGLMVSKKTGGAVQRNRLKRLLREAFRLSKNELKESARFIIYPKAGCAIKSLAQARTALGNIWHRARLK